MFKGNDAIQIRPGRLTGRFLAPPSKSASHRLLLMATYANAPVRIQRPLWSDDIRATLTALKALGYRFDREGEDAIFRGFDGPVRQPVTIDAGDSGTTARFLTAFAAVHPVATRLDGSARMRQRPMLELIEALTRLGIPIQHRDGHLPLAISGREVDGGSIDVAVSRSSQYLSALLLAAPRMRKGLSVQLKTPLVSASYVDMTVQCLSDAGLPVRVEGNHYLVGSGGRISIDTLTVEGDYSSAAYFLTGAVISGGRVRVAGLRRDSRQGDRQIIDILRKAGADIHWEQDELVAIAADLRGFEWDCQSCPDLVPTLAVLALFARGETRLRHIGHLRFKESDRIAAVLENIQRLGGQAAASDEDLRIFPRALHGGTLSTFNDHRMAMSFALAGLRVPGVRIENPGCVSKSFPEYWDVLEQLNQTN